VPTGDGMTYTWTGSVEAPNEKQSYVGKLSFEVTGDASEVSQMMTDPEQWTPPCYLEVLNFNKTSQTDSLDQLRTILEYNVKLDHHGDEACSTESASVSLSAGGVDNFILTLDDADMMVALSSTGFNVSIQT